MNTQKQMGGAILIDFGFSTPKLTAVDKDATQRAIAQAGAKAGTGAFSKKLWAPEDIKMVTTFRDEVRAFVYRVTLPWMHNGPRIMSTDIYMETAERIRKYRSEWDKIVTTFVENYEERLERAHAGLVGLYKSGDYPTPEEVRSRFDFRFTALPLPCASDFRLDLNDPKLEQEMAQNFENAKALAIDHAMDEVRARIVKYVGRMAEVASKKKVFDTVVTNITDLCSLLPALNLANDPQIEAIRQEMVEKFGTLHPDNLKGDDGKPVAEQAAKDAQQVLDKMSAYFGV